MYQRAKGKDIKAKEKEAIIQVYVFIFLSVHVTEKIKMSLIHGYKFHVILIWG